MKTAIKILLIWTAATQIAAAAAVTLLSAGPVVADGETAAVITLWAPRIGPEVKVKVKPAYGKVLKTERTSTGLIQTTWIPPFMKTSQEVKIRVTAKMDEPVDQTLLLPVVPPHQGELSVSFDPPLWRPGVQTVQVSVQASGFGPQAGEARSVLLSANAGTLTEAVNTGDGRFVAQWSPPATMKSSRYIIVGAADAAAPSEIYGWGSLPAHVEQSLSFQASPGSANVLKIGSRNYGPVTASPQGTLAFSVSVDPTDLSGQLETRLLDGRSFKTSVDLPLPSYPRVGFLPVPDQVPAGTILPILAAVIDRAGKPSNSARVMVNESAGPETRLDTTRREGVYRTLMPSTDVAAQRRLTLKMSDEEDIDSSQQIVHRTLQRLGPHDKVILEAPQSIGPKDRTLSFSTVVVDANHMPTKTRATLMVTPGRVHGRPTTKKNKTQARYKIAAGTQRLTALAFGPSQVTGLPASRVSIWPVAASVPPGETLPVIIAVTDALGAPVPQVSVKLGAMGGGVLPEEVQTNTSGIAVVDYTAGMSQGLSTLRAEAAGRWTSTTVWQGEASTGPGLSPASDGLTRSDIEGLQGVVTSALVLPPAPAPLAPVAAAPAPKPPTPAPTPAPAPSAPAPSAQALAPQASPVPAPPPAAVAPRTSTIDVQAGLAIVNQTFAQELIGKAKTIPPTVGFERAGSPGVDLRARYWATPAQALGYAAGARVYSASVDLTGETQDIMQWSGFLGVRYRGTLQAQGLKWIGLADVHRISLPIIQYKSAAKTKAEITTMAIPGLRLGGGLSGKINVINWDAVIAQTFSPSPVNTRIGLGGAYPIKPGFSGRLGLDLDLKAGTVEVDDAEVELSETEFAITFGIATTL